MECGPTYGIDRDKRQAERTLLFEYIAFNVQIADITETSLTFYRLNMGH